MTPISYFQRSDTPWPAMTLMLLCVLFFSVRTSAAAWVAVGENGTIINSTDGLTWSSATSATSETLRGVYFDGVGTWAAAGQQGTIVNSPDAVVWTQQTSGNTNPLWGTDGTILSSNDGISWTPQISPIIQNLRDVAVGRFAPVRAASIPALSFPLVLLLSLLLAGAGVMASRAKNA